MSLKYSLDLIFPSPYAMQILLGEHDVRVFEGTEQLMKTDTIIWHKEWVGRICHTPEISSNFVEFQHCQILSVCEFKRPNLLSCILVHSYDYQTLDYDIMLIKLFHPVKVTESVAPISLPTGCPYGGLMCSVSGWGKTSNDDNGGLTFGFLFQ